ncbi:uncharacterized protein FOMMEDRAFT_165713 [Fomitiporia mediterranea MF3/22]|uniref:uncharacterized protein n=1 Tax=Fomitiporia mediterranea (strain MF3/22) TaxID=694068 RepID=UPI0004407320|nr:uncharacterized protein FOMMEDRAFT_165713 [Fomitiporia mediterranea MF3/22]EJD07100.1 hypothetical protein FOMMEDRAFT_165713 [Fomitiporia mediterranea MF3/22]
MRTPSLLERLPVELIYEIHLLALNESLPTINKRFHGIFKSTTASYRAEYLYLRCRDLTLPNLSTRSINDMVGHALLYALCDEEEVLDRLLSLVESECVRLKLDVWNWNWMGSRWLALPLPKRLFRGLVPMRGPGRYTRFDQPLPFLRHLYAKAGSIANFDSDSLEQGEKTRLRIRLPDANAHEGYALSRAVHAGHTELVKFLLGVGGANPGLKDALAVRIAVKKRDLGLVRCLVEGEAEEEVVASSWHTNSCTDAFQCENSIECTRDERNGNEGRSGVGEVKDSQKRKSAKRRRVEDRVQVTTAMLRLAVEVDARDIVQYFMDKGARPDFATIQRMGRAGIV